MVLHSFKKKEDDGRTTAEIISEDLRKQRAYFLQQLRHKRNKEAGLSHKEVIDMIPRYLSDDLSDHELIAFLKHINSCRECYEELETMFMVDRTIHYLDDGEDGSFDLTPELIRDMEHKLHRVQVNEMLVRFRVSTALFSFFMFTLAVLDFFGIFPISRFL
jgi:hypothetical protein